MRSDHWRTAPRPHHGAGGPPHRGPRPFKLRKTVTPGCLFVSDQKISEQLQAFKVFKNNPPMAQHHGCVTFSKS